MERATNLSTSRRHSSCAIDSVSIRTTTTLRKENGKWMVIGHHTDTLAYLQK
jgi:hypothetical protein